MPSDPSTLSRVSLPYSVRPESSFHTVMTDRILRAGLELAREVGETGLTMRAIAARCGVSPTELYRHFPSKEAILVAIRSHGTQQLARWLSGEDGVQASTLEALCVQYIQFGRQLPWLYRIMFRASGVGRHDPAVDVFLRHAKQLLADDPDALAHAQQIWMALHGLVLATTESEPGHRNGNGHDDSARVETDFTAAYIRAVLHGLGTTAHA